MTSQAKRAWTAFTTVFFALVAMLGFNVPARNTAAVTATPAPAEPSGLPGRTADIPAVRKAPEATAPAPVVPLAWWALPKDRALPPTIKQRIRAEAHGSTPGTRHVPLESDTSSDDAVTEAAVGEAVLQPA